MIVLDTDHLSILQHDGSSAASQLRSRLEELKNERVVTTVISYEEQLRSWLSQIGRQKSVEKQIRYYDHLVRFADFFCNWELLPLRKEAAEVFRSLRKQKIRISTSDLKIASIVLTFDAKLLSRNLSDFEKVPDIKVENWLPG